VDRETALALASSINVVAGLFVALLLTRLESWRADARSAASDVRATSEGSFNDHDEALRAELRCWAVSDDMPIVSSIFIDLVVLASAIATYVMAEGVPALAASAVALAAPSALLLALVIGAQFLFMGSGRALLRAAPYDAFKKHP
jgi:hypothetical protein